MYIITESCNWTVKQPIGAIPQATSSTMVTTDDGRVVMFGGVYKGKACNDTRILNIGERQEVGGDEMGNILTCNNGRMNDNLKALCCKV